VKGKRQIIISFLTKVLEASVQEIIIRELEDQNNVKQTQALKKAPMIIMFIISTTKFLYVTLL
jgi:hypothetical protein